MRRAESKPQADGSEAGTIEVDRAGRNALEADAWATVPAAHHEAAVATLTPGVDTDEDDAI
jgi:hypothetical protein